MKLISLSKFINILIFINISFFMPLLTYADQLSFQKKLQAIEASNTGMRLGVSAINTANNMQFNYRANERFAMDSTSKFMTVATILKKSMTNPQLLKEKIYYTQRDINAAGYAPVTSKHIKEGMIVSDLCAAAMTQSDNAAMNLLVKKLGGSQVVTAFARSIGDKAFRLDRYEPELNSAIPGDLRDTTTPAAMAKSLQDITLGTILNLSQRQQLQMWLKNNMTGANRIRAGVPSAWTVGDKTGTGVYGTTNDIAIIWPSKCQPLIIVIYVTSNKKDAPNRESILASVTGLVIDEFANMDQCLMVK